MMWSRQSSVGLVVGIVDVSIISLGAWTEKGMKEA